MIPSNKSDRSIASYVPAWIGFFRNSPDWYNFTPVRRDDLLDLNDVLQHPGRELAVDIASELPEMEDLDLVAPVEGFLEAVSTGNALLITGEFKATVVLECSRCDRAIEMPIEFALDEQFGVVGIPSSMSHQDFAKVEADPDEPVKFFDENNLLVEALLQQTLLLNLPIHPACEGDAVAECDRLFAEGATRVIDNENSELTKLRALLSEDQN